VHEHSSPEKENFFQDSQRTEKNQKHFLSHCFILYFHPLKKVSNQCCQESKEQTFTPSPSGKIFQDNLLHISGSPTFFNFPVSITTSSSIQGSVL
jgi:hypothetical protein